MGTPEFTKAPLGSTVVLAGTKRKVGPACDAGETGRWYCATHEYLCRNNIDRNAHGDENGPHSFVWLCPHHGPEVAWLDARRRKPFNDRAGYVCSLKSGLDGGHVVIYKAAEARIDVTKGDRFAVSCETHNEIVSARTDPTARALMKTPSEWCSGCGAQHDSEQR